MPSLCQWLHILLCLLLSLLCTIRTKQVWACHLSMPPPTCTHTHTLMLLLLIPVYACTRRVWAHLLWMPSYWPSCWPSCCYLWLLSVLAQGKFGLVFWWCHCPPASALTQDDCGLVFSRCHCPPLSMLVTSRCHQSSLCSHNTSVASYSLAASCPCPYHLADCLTATTHTCPCLCPLAFAAANSYAHIGQVWACILSLPSACAHTLLLPMPIPSYFYCHWSPHLHRTSAGSYSLAALCLCPYPLADPLTTAAHPWLCPCPLTSAAADPCACAKEVQAHFLLILPHCYCLSPPSTSAHAYLCYFPLLLDWRPITCTYALVGSLGWFYKVL